MSAFLIDRTNVKRAAILGALGAALLFSVVPAQAQAQAEAQEEDNGYDIQLIRRVLSATGLRDDKPAIEYRERSPLVIPPNAALLPPPVAGGAAAPNWPVDPEVKAARARAQAAKPKPGMTGDPVIDDGRVLSPNELARGRAKRDVAASTEWTGKPLTNQELGAPNVFNFVAKAFKSGDDEEVAKFTAEPARTSLLEPPPGYQTPSASQPYGIGKKNQKPAANNYYGTFGTYEGTK